MLPVNYLMIAAVGLAVIVALGVGFAWVFARLYCQPRRRSATQTPADYELPFMFITFLSHGVYLNGWFIPPRAHPVRRPAIILTHGWSSNKAQLLPVARPLHEAGFGVLLYDARGHGASGGRGPITIAKFAEDLAAAIDYLEGRPDVDAKRLGVVGHSIGGASAILSASSEPRIRALVSSSAFADPVSLTWRFMRALHIPRWPFLWLVCRIIEGWLGASMVQVAPQNRIGQVTAPMLLIHGESDRLVPLSDMWALYGRANPTHTQRWLVPKRHHSNVILDSDFASVVGEFLTDHLTSEAQSDTSQGADFGLASRIPTDAMATDVAA